MRAAVIGAGVVGVSAAYRLARRGVAVTLYEQRWPGAGTSTTTFGWVNSHSKRPESYHRLNVEGCAEHERLARVAWPGGPAYVRTGNLEWAGDVDGLERLSARVARLAAAGYPARWLDRGRVAALEPDVRVPASVDRVAFFPTEGYVLPAVLIAGLLGAARRNGVELRCPASVTGLEPSPDGVRVYVETAAGTEAATYDRVVTCAGRWSAGLAASIGVDLAMVDPAEPGGRAVGLLAYTTPVPAGLGRVLTTPGLNVRPDGGGRLVLQCLDLDSDADPADPPAVDSALAATFRERLGAVLEFGTTARIVELRVGQRSLPADGLPVVGYLDPGRRCYAVVTHSGITLGPLLGRLAADEIVDDTPSPLLTDFRPGRPSSTG